MDIITTLELYVFQMLIGHAILMIRDALSDMMSELMII